MFFANARDSIVDTPSKRKLLFVSALMSMVSNEVADLVLNEETICRRIPSSFYAFNFISPLCVIL